LRETERDRQPVISIKKHRFVVSGENPIDMIEGHTAQGAYSSVIPCRLALYFYEICESSKGVTNIAIRHVCLYYTPNPKLNPYPNAT
jgi:hypothetical protein